MEGDSVATGDAEALADPTDDLAPAGLLRSPAVGLTDMALVHLREAQRAQELPSLWAMLQRTDLDLPADEGARAREAAALIRELNRMVGRTAVADVLKDFLDRTSYRAILLRAGETRAANNVSKLLADAHTSGIVSVDVFVAYLAELRDVAPREGEARALTAGAVQIMSVHQAKGLEFAVVVLGDAARANPGSRGLLIDPGEARTGMGILPPTTASRVSWAADGSRQVEQVASLAYRLAQRREQDRADAESDRLLYVAATRARELLIVSGTLGVSARGTLSVTGWLAQLELALQMTASAPACDPDGSTVHTFSLGLDELVVQCTLYEPAAPLPSGAVRQEPLPALALPEDLRLLERVDGLEAHVDDAVREAERDPPRRVWRVVPRARRAWAPAWVVGELVHQALAAWSFPEDGHGIFTRRAAAAARNAGLTDEARIANAVQRAARMLLRFRGTELYAAMASAPQRLLEVPYSVLDAEGRLNAGVIDALWCADGQWHLVEFKTDRIRDETALAEHLRESDYVAQVARYVAAAAQVLGQRPDPMLCFLSVGGRVRLVMDRWANDAG